MKLKFQLLFSRCRLDQHWVLTFSLFRKDCGVHKFFHELHVILKRSELILDKFRFEIIKFLLLAGYNVCFVHLIQYNQSNVYSWLWYPKFSFQFLLKQDFVLFHQSVNKVIEYYWPLCQGFGVHISHQRTLL